jgi:hypothetical protein
MSCQGTVWAFHGSRSENWHAILRQGVRNLSGTAGQLNGAAYGPGVYVSPTAAMSLGYSQMHGAMAARGGNNNNAAAKAADEDGVMFLDGGSFYCLAICEIVSGAEKRHNASIWTIVDDTQIVTRFFMVWPPGTSAQAAMKWEHLVSCFSFVSDTFPQSGEHRRVFRGAGAARNGRIRVKQIKKEFTFPALPQQARLRVWQ